VKVAPKYFNHDSNLHSDYGHLVTDSSVFSDFTKKYSLSKTLRFELKPVDDTKKYLKPFVQSDQ